MNCPAFTKSKHFRIFAIIILVAIVTGVSWGFYQFMRKPADLKNVKAEYVLNSGELYSAFEKDEAAATAKYSGHIIEITGNVAQVEYGSIDSTLNITLRPDDEFSGVICTFSGKDDKNIIKNAIGEQITVRGECSGMLLDVLLNNCVLVEK